MRIGIFILLILSQLWLRGQDTLCYLDDVNRFPRERFVDFEQLDLKLNFQPELGKLNGEVKHSFRVLRTKIDTLFLDGINLTIKEAQFDGSSVDYVATKKGITFHFDSSLTLGNTHELYIKYSAEPKKGLYFIGWDDSTGRSRKQIWTQGQGIDNRNWIPLFDDMSEKVKTNIEVTFQTGFEVLSNGYLVNQKSAQNIDFTVWQYEMKMPHSPYLIMLGIGKYSIKKDRSSSGVILNQYVYEDKPETAEPTYRHSKKIFDFLENEIGVPYPWGNTYSQIPVQDFPYGAMENTTATIFGDFYCVDSSSYNDANYVYVNGHELAHQWFGDLVTSRSPAHHWLHESFATYYHCLVSGHVFGDDEFRKMMFDNQAAALQAGHNDHRGVGHSQANSSRHYLKGSFVLKMLRYVVGDEEFKLGLQRYLADHSYELVNTQDLIDAFHDATGQEIGWFIDQWVSKGGEPHLKVVFETNKKSKSYQLIVEQLQDTTDLVPTFRMPVWTEIHFENGGVERKQFWLENHKDTFEIPYAKKRKISYVLFDPNQEVLKRMYFKRSTKWLLNQAINAKNMIDRYESLIDMRTIDIKEKEEALRSIFNQETYHLTRAEALNQLISENAYGEAEIKALVGSNDSKLQSSVLSRWTKIEEQYEPYLKQLLNAKSYNVVQLALIRLVISFPENYMQYVELTKEETGTRGHNVRIQWLEIKAAKAKDKKAIDELVDLTSNSFDFLTRQNAISALKRLNYCDEKLIVNLAMGVQKANWKLSSTCGNLIKHFYNSDKKVMVEKAVNTMNMSTSHNKRVEYYLKAVE